MPVEASDGRGRAVQRIGRHEHKTTRRSERLGTALCERELRRKQSKNRKGCEAHD
jgi:hypothetical protein